MRKIAVFILFGILNLTGYTQTNIDSVNLLMLTHSYPEALQYSNKQIKDNGANAQVFYQRALIYKLMYRYPEATSSILKAMELDSINTEYLSEYGSLLLKKDKEKEAIQIFEKVMRQDSNHVYSSITLANYYLKEKEYNQAYEILNHLFKNDTTNAYFARNLGLCSIKLKDKENSIKWLSKAISLDSTDIKAYDYLALVYISLKEFDLALENLNKAIKIDPDNKELHVKIGDLHVMRNHHFQAIPAYLKAYQLDSTDAFLTKSIGLSYFKIKKYDKAKQFLDLANSSFIDLQVFEYLGYVHAQINQPDSSILFFNEALKLLKPDNGEIFSIKKSIAENYYHLNNFEKAIEVYNEALELDLSDHYWVSYTKNELIIDIAAIYQNKLNDKLKAIAYYEKVFEPKIAINNDYYTYAQQQIKKLKEELFFESK